jgi:hypothetical protein
LALLLIILDILDIPDIPSGSNFPINCYRLKKGILKSSQTFCEKAERGIPSEASSIAT